MLGKEGSSRSAAGFLTHIIYTVGIQVTLLYEVNYNERAGRRVESPQTLLAIDELEMHLYTWDEMFQPRSADARPVI